MKEKEEKIVEKIVDVDHIEENIQIVAGRDHKEGLVGKG